MRTALVLCCGIAVGYVGFVVLLRFYGAVWDEAAEWRKAWKATDSG